MKKLIAFFLKESYMKLLLSLFLSSFCLFSANGQNNPIMDPVTLVGYRGNINSHYFFRIDLFSDLGGTVWGTTTYTDDSRLARSARHRYGLAYGYRYVVEVIILPGYSSYSGSIQHGITSLDYGIWPGSYIFNNWWYASRITFNKQSGSGGSDNATGVYNLSLHSITPPTRTGYSFNGYWTSASGGTRYYNNNGTSARTWDYTSADVTLHAQWHPNTLVTFDKQSGTGGTNSVTAIFGNNMPSATAPGRTGYTFAGYWDAISGGTQYYTSAMTSARTWDKSVYSATLYARWTANQYTVTLDQQSGSGGSTSVTATYDSPMPSATAPTRTGYTFAGYWDATSGGNQYYSNTMASARNWDKTSPATLYARWTANEYTVTFDKQSGTGGTDNVTATFDSPMPAADAPCRPGYTFEGYWDATSGGTQYYTDAMASARNWDIASHTTLHAQWLEITGNITDPEAAICVGSSYTVTASTAIASNYTSVLWSHNGEGTLDNATTFTPTYNSDADDAGKDVILTMEVTGTDICGTSTVTATNQVTITVEPTPYSGSLAKHPNDASVEMGSIVSVTLTPGVGGNLTDELQYRTHDGTSWSNWENYTSGNEISSFLKTEIQVRTWREADYCAPAGIVTVSWDVEQTSVVNVNEGFVYYFIQHAIDAASEGDTIRIGTNIYPENINTTNKGGLTLQPGFSEGIVTVTGTFTLSAGDLLEMELFGDDDYDKFIIEDEAQINGASLDIKVVGTYKPAAGTRFIIFTSPNNPGEFSNPTLVKTNGHQFILSYEHDAVNGQWNVVLTSLAPLLKLEIHHIESRP